MGQVAPTKRGAPRTRSSLIVRLKDWQDQESWQDFDRIYRKLIFDTALRAGLTETEAQEAVQETLLSVAKKIAGFDYDPAVGSFKSWLLQITRRRIVDQMRKRRAGNALVNDQTLAQLPDPSAARLEALWNEEWHQSLLDMARALVKRRVGERQFRMFELYVMQQLPLKDVTRLLRVNAAQVYMAKYRITRLLKRELKDLENERL